MPRSQLPKISFSRLASAPPAGSIQFFDGYFPALTAGTYHIEVKHTLQAPSGPNPEYKLTQTFKAEAPEFTIDPLAVESVYPPKDAAGIYGQQLPFLVLTDPSLARERSLVPGQHQPSRSNPTPWIALLLFTEKEISLAADSNSPVSTAKVRDLLAPNPDVLKPQLPAGWVAQELLESQCQTITIPGATFNAVMPLTTDLPYTAHCRAVNVEDEDPVLLSVVAANRLPVPNLSETPAAPLRYYAHLVSLEGFAAYLGPNGQPIPNQPGKHVLMDVQLVSLYNWSFVSMPQPGLSFLELVTGLISSEELTPTLKLPVPPEANLPAPAAARLAQGFVPVTFVSGSGEETFAWYRGPFTAEVPQPAPAVGNPPVPISQATSAEELIVYLAEQGLFDLSYAAAWNIGRGLALADANFAQEINGFRTSAQSALTAAGQRAAMPHLAGATLHQLMARDATRSQFASLMATGLGRDWTEALGRARIYKAPSASQRATRAQRGRRRFRPHHLLGHPHLNAALAGPLEESTNSIAAWLANLTLLFPLPFSYLVPDPHMLPVESIRFFYVDPSWIDALFAGAMSIGIHGSADTAVQRAMLPSLTQAVSAQRLQRFRRRKAAAATPQDTATKMSGVLLRSQLVSAWPGLAVSATRGGAPLHLVRDDCPSQNVRLVLFDGIPDTVTLGEPYQGLNFGVQDNGIVPRYVTAPNPIGKQIPGAKPVPPGGYSAFLDTYCRTRDGAVVKLAELASALATATGAGSSFGAGDFAIQVVRAPELQKFTSAS
ncbi:MAG TPA: hypothetical protein VHU83_23835 [Bryobacteraceae bacterium]|jgi:hypothetical protein|nr:hypothetical protein [Bryobacteraceae bacterium]